MPDDTDRVSICRRGDELLLRAVGRVIAHHCPAMRAEVESASSAGALRVTVFLRDCTHFDSTFMGTLLNLRKCTAVHGPPRVALVAPSPQVLEIMNTMRTLRLFEVEPHRDPPDDVAWRVLDCDPQRVPRATFARSVIAAHEELAAVPGPLAERFRIVAAAAAQDLEAESDPG